MEVRASFPIFAYVFFLCLDLFLISHYFSLKLNLVISVVLISLLLLSRMYWLLMGMWFGM